MILFFGLQTLQAENIFIRFWQQQLFNYAEKRLPMVASLTESEKQIIFKEDATKSVAILLHEFAEPNAITLRKFDTSHAISNSLLKSAGFKKVMRTFLKESKYLDTITGFRKMIDYRYVMTPRKTPASKPITSQFLFAVNEHLKLAVRPNISQLFLGSYVVNMEQINDSIARVKIYNETSRNSLFLHLPENVQKPFVFGTVAQEFNLQININHFK